MTRRRLKVRVLYSSPRIIFMSKLKKSEYPKYLQGYPELKAIYIGCPYDVLPPDADAHSIHEIGTICFKNKQKLRTKIIGLHELAHLLVSSEDVGHRDPWRNMLRQLAGPLAEEELALYPKIKRKKMKKYYCIREQAGDGCDYSIGCGTTISMIHADSLEEAQKKIIDLPDTWKEDLLAQIATDGDVDGWYHDYLVDSGLGAVMPDDYGTKIASVSLIEVSEEIDMMPILRAKLVEAEAFKDGLNQAANEEAERAAYEKLKKKFEKKAK